ncbi:hypothetical protein H0H92_004700, partial [Tricholoma furcatifolium]
MISLFDYLTFPKDITIISTRLMDFPPLDDPVTTAQTLTQRLDELTNGPVVKLTVELESHGTIKCWKPKQMKLDGAPTIVIELRSVAAALQVLRLDQLVYFIVEYSPVFDNSNFWTFIGNLPQFAELKVNGYAEALITVLSSNLK